MKNAKVSIDQTMLNQFTADDFKNIKLTTNRNPTDFDNEIYHEFITALFRIEKILAEVLSSNELAYILKEIQIQGSHIRKTFISFDKKPLARYFTSVINLIRNYSSEYEYSPCIDLFFRCCFKLELQNEWFNNPRANTSKPGKKAYELFNNLIELIRYESTQPEFKRQISDRNFNSLRNYQSAVDFVTKLLARRLLVLRVDFSYQSVYSNSVTPLQAKADLADFLQHFRRNHELTENLEGYLWKWEFSEAKKMHCHLLLFYDSSKVRDDAYWANRIVSLWEALGIPGQRRSYNGNKPENKQKFEDKGELGIGVVARIGDDSDTVNGKAKRDILLNIIVKYIMKPEQYLLAIPSGHEKDRLFGKGYGPNRHGKKKADKPE